MRDDLDDYLISIGKVAIAAAFLEEVVIHWGAWLSDNPQGTLLKRLHRGLDKNLDFLADRVEERISSAKKKPVLDLIETSRSLKNKRNENIHGVWSVVANSKTVVMCSRYEKDATGNLSWDDLSTPSIAEV